MLDGIQVYEDSNLTKLVAKHIRRSWIERLFSWPWQPWVAQQTIFVNQPDPYLYWIGRGKLIGHPDTAKKMFDEARLVLATGECIPLTQE